MSFVLYPDPASDWNEGEKKARTASYDTIGEAKKKFGDKVDLGAWNAAHDHQYLGLCGPLYNGRQYGNDSSSMQAVLNQPGFWRRVAYRPKPDEIVEKHKERNRFTSLSLTGQNTISEPDATLNTTTTSWKKRAPKPYVPKCEQVDVLDLAESYPKFVSQRERYEKINFFNTMGNKYEIRPGRAARVDRQAHTSSKAEINFMAHKWNG